MSGKKVSLKVIVAFALSLFIGMGIFPLAHADDVPESITLSPTSKHYQLRAGETTRDQLTIVNDGKTDYTFRVYTEPYSVRDENYEPDFSTMRHNTDIGSWVDFEKSSYFIKAGETITVRYSMSVPKNATPGGHYGVLFAETQPSETPVGNSVARKKRVGALVYTTVAGDYKVGGHLVSSDIPFLQFRAPLTTAATVENTGNTDFAVTAGILVTDLFGSKKYEASKTYQVLPEGRRKIQREWPQAASFGLFKVTATTSFLNQDETKTGYVFMAPVWTYLAAVLAALVATIYFVQKRRS